MPGSLSLASIRFHDSLRALQKPRHNLFFEEIQRGDDVVVREITDVEHAHEVPGAHLLHLRLNVACDGIGGASDHVPRGHQIVPTQFREIDTGAVAFAKIRERPLTGELGEQGLLVGGGLVDGVGEAPVKQREKIAERWLGNCLRFRVGLVEVDVTAQNELFGGGFPSGLLGNVSVVPERVLDLRGCLGSRTC